MLDRNNSLTHWLIAQTATLRWRIELVKQVPQVFVRLFSSNDKENNISLICNLQHSPRLLELYAGGKIEKVWGSFFQPFLFCGLFSHSIRILINYFRGHPLSKSSASSLFQKRKIKRLLEKFADLQSLL